MYKKLYDKYFQKSYTFLFPITRISKNSRFNPLGTYIALDGIYKFEDCKLICLYKHDNDSVWNKFKYYNFTVNVKFEKEIVLDEYRSLIIFDLSEFKEDYEFFLQGKYSKFSDTLKQILKDFYKPTSPEWFYIDSFINPAKYFDIYSKLLETDIRVIKEVGELCNKYNEDKEHYTIKILQQ